MCQLYILQLYKLHETSAQCSCTGKTQRDGMEREAGGGRGDREWEYT